MSAFLFEILSEEVPARMQAAAIEALEKAFRERLEKSGVAVGGVQIFSTPRRMAIAIDGLPDAQGDRSEEFRGPRTDAPEAAIQGFLKARGVTLDRCTQQVTDKGTYWIYNEHIPGKRMEDLLAGLCADVIGTFAWPKSMRWSNHGLRWVRPLLSVLAVFKGKPVAFAVPQTDGIVAGHTTRGHRFLAPATIEITDLADYQEKMAKAFVILDRAQRREKIWALAQDAARQEGLSLLNDDALIDELTGLVEWPSVAVGAFDSDFLSVPQEALIAAMRGHQKYLSLTDKDGKLANKFIVITNMPPEGARKDNIVSGNEKVLRARLSDARFFWDQDLKTPLAARRPRLRDITFHAKLGTLDQKVERLIPLAGHIAGLLKADKAKAEAAAALCKTDLVTAMVGEFPELQGLMGMYYARQQGEAPEVCRAISEHYKPAGPSDAVPEAPISIAVALADKIDTITGFFAVNEKPTGSKDPFALRRAALGIIRIILQNDLRMPLEDVISVAVQNYAAQGHAAVTAGLKAAGGDKGALRTLGIFDFICDRMKFALKDDNVRADVIDAVFSTLQGDAVMDISRLVKRVRAVQALLATPEGSSLLAGYKRATNIVRIEREKEKRDFPGDVESALLKLEEESALFEMLRALRRDITPMLAAEDYARAMTAMATLQKPVDRFFDKVIVNDNDAPVRENRLKLLTQVREVVNQIADFSLIK